jgi:hypothetical protein
MTYKMTPEYQKVLTKMIGEDYHEPTDYGDACVIGGCCEYKSTEMILAHCEISNRTFTTDADMMKVFRWLVDNGKWSDFFTWFARRKETTTLYLKHSTWPTWLFYDAERFCCLVAQCKMEGVV